MTTSNSQPYTATSIMEDWQQIHPQAPRVLVARYRVLWLRVGTSWITIEHQKIG